MIEKAGQAARPDRVEVQFGLRFSASGGVIMAGVAGEASLWSRSAMTPGRGPPPGRPQHRPRSRGHTAVCGRRNG